MAAPETATYNFPSERFPATREVLHALETLVLIPRPAFNPAGATALAADYGPYYTGGCGEFCCPSTGRWRNSLGHLGWPIDAEPHHQRVRRAHERRYVCCELRAGARYDS